MDKNINVTLKVWRQKGPKEKGRFETYQLNNIFPGCFFLGNAGYSERTVDKRR